MGGQDLIPPPGDDDTLPNDDRAERTAVTAFHAMKAECDRFLEPPGDLFDFRHTVF